MSAVEVNNDEELTIMSVPSSYFMDTTRIQTCIIGVHRRLSAAD